MSIAYSCPEDSCKDEAVFPESQAGVEILLPRGTYSACVAAEWYDHLSKDSLSFIYMSRFCGFFFSQGSQLKFTKVK